MEFKDKALCKVRTITTFLVLSDDRATWQSAILGASQFCSDLSKQFLAEGYNVQSIRIVTNPFGEYLRTSTLEDAKQDLAYLNKLLNTNNQSGLRIRFAIGEVITPEEIALLPVLIKSYGDLCNASVNIPMDEFGVLENDLFMHLLKQY